MFRARRNGGFVLPHLSCHIVQPSQFIGKTVSVYNEDKTNNFVKRFCREELDLASTPQPSRTSIVMARLMTTRKAKSLALRASWALQGSPWLFRWMTLPPRQEVICKENTCRMELHELKILERQFQSSGHTS